MKQFTVSAATHAEPKPLRLHKVPRYHGNQARSIVIAQAMRFDNSSFHSDALARFQTTDSRLNVWTKSNLLRKPPANQPEILPFDQQQQRSVPPIPPASPTPRYLTPFISPSPSPSHALPLLSYYRSPPSSSSPSQPPIPPISPDDMSKTVRAVILAGGETTNPLTKHRAMPAVPLGASNLRIIDIPINNCLTSGINKIYILTQFHSSAINSHIVSSYPPLYLGGPDKQCWVDVLAAQQTPSEKDWYKGSADALRKNMSELKDESRGISPATEYVVLSGAAIYNLDIPRMVAQHRATGADITMALHPVGYEEATTKGIARVHQSSGRVLRFEEKPSTDESLQEMRLDFVDQSQNQPKNVFLASMGVYVFKREALFSLLEPSKSPAAAITHIGHHVIPNAIAQDLKVYGFRHDGYWRDVSNLESYYEAQLELTWPEAPLKMDDIASAMNTRGRGLLSPPARILGSASVDCSLLNDGAVLNTGSVVNNSIIGDRIYIGKNSIIESSVLLHCPVWTNQVLRTKMIAAGERVYGVGDDCHLRRCIVDENVSIGNNVKILNTAGVMEADRSKSDGYVIKNGLVVIIKDAIIPDGFEI